MNKNTKIGLTLIGVAVTTALTQKVMAMLDSKETKEERMKKDIINAWNEIKNEVVSKLNLHKTPVLEFDNLRPQAVMYVSTELKTQGFLFDKKVIDSRSDYIIHINIDNVINSIDCYKKLSLWKSPSITSIAIKQFLYHECRHIWQGQEGFYIGQTISPFVSFNVGHGEKPEEVDANEFAYSMAKTNKEKAFAMLQRKLQETSGKIFDEDCSTEQRAFVREFNPMLKLFVGV